MSDLEKKPLIILTGPTAVGKTKLSIALAKAVGGEILSADSMQVYRHMDIGSAKISHTEMNGVRHHLIDILEPTEQFNVVMFQNLCKEAMEEIYSRGHIPIVVGGTGFYIQALLYDIHFSGEEEDNAYRRKLEELAEEPGGELKLHEMLSAVDPEAARQIHWNNKKRVIRALEYYQHNGKPISRHNEEERARESCYRFCYFVLDDERASLYRRIDERVDLMLKEGLVEEVLRLKEMGCRADMVSMQGLGYKQLLAWMDGQMDYEQAVEIIKRDTRHFAKRQLTWFRRERNVIWVNKAEYGYDDAAILQMMIEKMKAEGIVKE